MIDFAKAMGIELMPWQSLVLHDSLACTDAGDFLRRRVGVLVARQQGKSALMRVRVLAGMFLWGETWVSMAQNRKLALDQLNQAAEAAKRIPWLKNEIAKHRMSNGDEMLELRNGARWTIAAATREGPRGMTGNLWVDELREIGPESWGAATPVTRAVPNSQIWVTSNAGDAHSTVLNDFRAGALTGIDPGTAWYEWSAEPHLDIHDRRGWAQANPALGWTVEEAMIEAAAATDSIETFRTETLCQWVEAIEGAWNMEAWANCRADLDLAPGLPTWLAIDVTPNRKRADLVAGQLLDDGRVAVGLVQSWHSDGAVNDLLIAGEVSTWAQTYEAQAVGFDRYAAGNIAARLTAANIPTLEIPAGLFAQACDETLSAMGAGRIVHSGQPDLDAAMGASVRRNASDGGWRIIRRGSSAYISPAVGVVMVCHMAQQPQKTAEIIVA